MIVAVVAGYIYMPSGWALLVLIVLTLPIVIFENAVPIVAISTLAVCVDRIFLDGPFHHQLGGLLFSVIGIVLFVLVLGTLQKVEDGVGQRRRLADRKRHWKR